MFLTDFQSDHDQPIELGRLPNEDYLKSLTDAQLEKAVVEIDRTFSMKGLTLFQRQALMDVRGKILEIAAVRNPSKE